MNTERNHGSQVGWRLREIMAAAGMYQTTDLVEPLRAAGVNLSREQVYRLVTRQPIRVNMVTIAAICDIFSCSVQDLMPLIPRALPLQRVAGVVEDSGDVISRPKAERGIGDLRPVPARLHRPHE